MLYILIAIILFGLLIALHEFGHFAAAKLCGVKVNEFAIGMGPQVLHRQMGETDYSLRLFPVGGFCAMEGEEEGESPDPRAFPNRPWYQRLVILLAGVFMNFLTGYIIIFCLFSGAWGFLTPTVSQVQPGANAARQGLQAGDRILKIDGHAVYLESDISFFLSRAGKSTLQLRVAREDGKHDLTVDLTPYRDEATGQERLMLGILMGEFEEATLPVKLKYAWFQAVDYVRLVWFSLGDMITGAVGLRDISGPVGIIGMVGEMGEQGAQAAVENDMPAFYGALVYIFNFVAFLSINLSVMNLLPIPALDGGQIFFLAVNGVLLAIRGRKLDPKYQGWVSVAGFVCLMTLMVIVTVSDIMKKMGV